MTERKCENNEMVAKERCEEAKAFAWWDGMLSTLSFGVVIGYKLAEAGSRLAKVNLRLGRLKRLR